MKIARQVLLAGGLALLAAIAQAQTPAQAVMLNIAEQPMTDALNALAEQTGLHVIFPAPAVEGKVSPKLEGRYTAEAALKILLSGTQLSYEFVDARTIAIRVGSAAAAASATSRKLAWAQAAGGNANEPGNDSATNTGERSERPSPLNAVEEIVVTAQKREERLKDVPISISVLSGDELDHAVDQGATEALSRVPGVSVSEGYQGGTANLAVRGVTAASGSFFGSSPIGYYLDAVPFGFVKSAIAPDPNVYDLERIEVLRGPQGTLYGANAQNGVVRVLTKDPDLHRFELKTRAALSSTENGGGNYRGDAAVNIPVVDGKLAARAVVSYQDLSGWIDKPNQRNSNDAQLRNARLKVNAQPTDQLSIGLSAWLSRSDFGGPSTGDDDARRASPASESITTDFDAYGLKVGYDFAAFSVTSATSYLTYENDSFLDGSFNGANLVLTHFDAETLAQEINLASTTRGAWRWTVGGIYRDGEDRVLQRLGTTPIPLDRTDESKSFALFGELTRLFVDGRFELTGGLRYFEDDLQGDERSRFGAIPAAPLRPDAHFDAWSPRVILTWHPSEQQTFYASYAEGFRSGFYQTPSVLAAFPAFPPAKPDNLKNYELGAKGSLLDRRVDFDAAVYYMDWEDVQQSILVAVSPALNISGIINSESASGVGVDFGVTARPIAAMELGINFSWNDLAVDADVRSGNFLLFEKGDRLNLSAEYTAGASADYEFSLGGGYTVTLSASANLTAPREWRTLGPTGARIKRGDAILLGRTSFSIDSPQQWAATVFVDNVGNEQGSPARQPFLATTRDWDARIRPRTYGVQVEYRF